MPPSTEYRYEPRCKKCKSHLFGEIEVDVGICDDCADTMYERSQRRAEWDHFHPGEPCPKEELEP